MEHSRGPEIGALFSDELNASQVYIPDYPTTPSQTVLFNPSSSVRTTPSLPIRILRLRLQRSSACMMRAGFVPVAALPLGSIQRPLLSVRPRQYRATQRRCARACAQGPNNGDEALVDVWIRQAREAYDALPPLQQLYVQCVYLTVVISGMLSVGATMVRMYAALRSGTEFTM